MRNHSLLMAAARGHWGPRAQWDTAFPEAFQEYWRGAQWGKSPRWVLRRNKWLGTLSPAGLPVQNDPSPSHQSGTQMLHPDLRRNTMSSDVRFNEKNCFKETNASLLCFYWSKYSQYKISTCTPLWKSQELVMRIWKQDKYDPVTGSLSVIRWTTFGWK